ncbi:hypothetical protein GJ496_003424 [Pomphorhynchus laevis]|nr:hypothetical protein GJ496_003424 [Pomphorhynchus laevis]
MHELLCCSNSKSLYDLDNTLEILLKSKTSVVDAARHSKLSCLNMLFLSIDHMSLAYLTSLFEECLHCICTGSNKTVKLAMNLLLNLCQYRIENDKTCTESDLFFDLCKSVDKFTRDHEQTTAAQCCCANVLTQLVKQYKHLVIGQCVNWLMNKVKELFNISNEMSRVFNRACVLCATLIKILDSIVLMAMLDPLLRALFTNYKGNTSRAKSKLKIALRLLAEKVGLDMVVNHLPVSDPSINVIIRNIRKSIRKDRSNENKAETVVTSSFAPTLRSTATTKISKRLKRKRQAMETSTNTIIKEDEGHPLDLLDTESIARFHIPNIKSDCGNEEDAFTLDSSGRIVVQLESDEDKVESDTTSQDIDQQINSLSLGVNKNEKSASFGVKKRKYAHSGEQYMSKRARGDVKKKDKPDPYAYIPLTSDMANKRKTTKSGKQFKTAVRKAKLGAQRAARHGHKRRM